MPEASGYVLTWSPVTGRVYSVWSSTNASEGFAPLPGAVELPTSMNSFTNTFDVSAPQQFYRLEVRKP